ncbi:MAG: hypothetical protein WC300_05465 [Candidatus Omnitrophota bacterium]|jgi:hypothetical protein
MGEAMNILHKGLAAGRWFGMPFAQQMANIGSEVNRAVNWRDKGDEDLSRKVLMRALELIDMSVLSLKQYPGLKELLRVRELLVDFFHGFNKFSLSVLFWKKYFGHFNYLSRKHCLW